MSDDWQQQQSASFWKPSAKGEELVGEVVAIDDGQYGKNYTVKQANDELAITGANKALLPRMMKVVIGSTVKIVYQGEELPKIKGYRPTQLFDVFIKKA